MNNTQSNGEAMSVAEISQAAGISRATVTLDITSGTLPAKLIGNSYMVRHDDAEVYIAARRNHLELQAAADAALAGLRATMKERAEKRAAQRGRRGA